MAAAIELSNTFYLDLCRDLRDEPPRGRECRHCGATIVNHARVKGTGRMLSVCVRCQVSRSAKAREGRPDYEARLRRRATLLEVREAKKLARLTEHAERWRHSADKLLGLADAERLVARIAEHTGVPLDALLSVRRNEALAWRRHVVAWLLRQCGYSYPVIGLALRRHHATAINSVRVVEARRTISEPFRAATDRLLDELRGASERV